MKDFEKYLFDLLWKRGEDCCSKCSRCDPQKCCDNCDDDGVKDTDICFKGMKEYFEKHG